MKPTGIVCRVDDLGCIVIPKETRRTLRIQEGALTENIDSGGWVLMSYVAIEDALSFPIRWKPIIKITCRAFAQAGDFLIS